MKKEIKIFIIIQILVILLYFSIKIDWIRFLPECILRNKFDFICPSCGVTRMIVSLYKFKIKDAFLYNPIFFITLIYTIIIYIAYLVNFFFKKNIKIFRWWHVVIWGIIVVVFTLVRNFI